MSQCDVNLPTYSNIENTQADEGQCENYNECRVYKIKISNTVYPYFKLEGKELYKTYWWNIK